MNASVDIFYQPGALVQIAQEDGASVEVLCGPAPTVEVMSSGPQGPQGDPAELPATLSGGFF